MPIKEIFWPKRSKKEGTQIALPDFQLEGFRVFVAPPKMEDWPGWAELRKRNREFLKPMEPLWVKDCLKKSYFERRLFKQVENWESGRAYAFLIFKKDTEGLIGGINLNNVCKGAAQFASLGYWLDKNQQGHGYMNEALSLVIAYAFTELKLHRLNAGCLQHNERSIKLLRRLGFTEEGMAKKYLNIAGQWQDHLLFGLNVEDFS